MTRGAETKQQSARRFTGRVTLVTALFALVASSLVARAVYLQVLDKDFLNQQADTRHLRTEKISAHRGTPPATTLMDLIREAQEYRRRTGEEYVESVIAVSMSEEDIDRFLQWPWANVCTDGELWGSHPRGFGSFPRVLGQYVRERGVLSLEDAIHKMTDRAALNAGLPRRARVEPERFADLVLFDPSSVGDRATTDDPRADSVGILKVWVNGELVWDQGEVTDARPGRVLRRPSS